MNPRNSNFSTLITATVFAVALSLLHVPSVFAGFASAGPSVVSVGAGTAGAKSGAGSAMASAKVLKIAPPKIYTHPAEVLVVLSKREVELYREYFEELFSSLKEHRMPKVKDELIEELFKNTALMMLFATFAVIAK